MAAHKLVLDGDYGIDDSLAALFLCPSARRGDPGGGHGPWQRHRR